MALLRLAGIDDHWGLALAESVPKRDRDVVASQLASGTGVVHTSSAGRLFDGVAALLGICLEVGYEAQAAIELEHRARSATRSVRLQIGADTGVLKLGPMVRDLIAALRDGADVDALALGFHEALADATALVVIRRAAELGVTIVGLTGGVMQNKLLVRRLTQVLERAGLVVLVHHLVPPNDGGLSLGQAVVGRARLLSALSGVERSLDAFDGQETNENHQLSGREGDD